MVSSEPASPEPQRNVETDFSDVRSEMQACESILASGAGTSDFFAARGPERAPRWSEAAAAGSADARYLVGRCHEIGAGVTRDESLAADSYRKAAEQGHVLAMHNLGTMFMNGRGVDPIDSQAVAWFRKAADAGYAPSQYNLGFLYANGRGVPCNSVMAEACYRSAAKQGHAGAQKALDWMSRNETAAASKVPTVNPSKDSDRPPPLPQYTDAPPPLPFVVNAEPVPPPMPPARAIPVLPMPFGPMPRGVPAGSDVRLRTVADTQKLLILALATRFVATIAGIFAFASLVKAGWGWANVTPWIAGFLILEGVVLHAAFRTWQVANISSVLLSFFILFELFALLFPPAGVVSLIFLAIANSRLTRELRAAGLQVGFFGLKGSPFGPKAPHDRGAGLTLPTVATAIGLSLPFVVIAFRGLTGLDGYNLRRPTEAATVGMTVRTEETWSWGEISVVQRRAGQEMQGGRLAFQSRTVTENRVTAIGDGEPIEARLHCLVSEGETRAVAPGRSPTHTWDTGESQGRTVLPRKADGRWRATLEGAEPTTKQRTQLEQWTAAEEAVELYPNRLVKPGEAWRIEGAALRRFVVEPAARIEGGQVNLKFERVGEQDGEPCAFLTASGEIRYSALDSAGRKTVYVFTLDGRIVRSLRHAVDLEVRVQGTLQGEAARDAATTMVMSGPFVRNELRSITRTTASALPTPDTPTAATPKVEAVRPLPEPRPIPVPEIADKIDSETLAESNARRRLELRTKLWEELKKSGDSNHPDAVASAIRRAVEAAGSTGGMRQPDRDYLTGLLPLELRLALARRPLRLGGKPEPVPVRYPDEAEEFQRSVWGVRPQPKTPEKTVPEKKVPEPTIDKPIPEKSVPEKMVVGKTAPEKTISEKPVPEKALPEKPVPEKTVPEKTVPEKVAPSVVSWDHLHLPIARSEKVEDFVRLVPPKVVPKVGDPTHSLITKRAFSGPIEISVEVRMDGVGDLRFYAFTSAMLIFNWGDRDEFRVARPDAAVWNKGSAFTASTRSPVKRNTWHHVVWRITPKGMEVLVDGRSVFTERRTYDLAKHGSVVRLGGAFGAAVDVRRFEVTRLDE